MYLTRVSACCSFLLFALLATSTLAQAGKYAGNWKRESCTCTSRALVNGTCNDVWLSEYRVKAQGASFVGDGINGTRQIAFTVDSAGQATMTVQAPVPGYICTGVMTKGLKCRMPDETLACTVQFSCTSGDCVTTVVQQNMRSIMYPIMVIVIGLVWFIWPLIGGLVSPKILAIALAAVIYALSVFMIIVPPFYHAIVVMAIAAFAFNAVKAGGSWEIKLAIFASIFGFLMMCGLNVFAGNLGSTNYFDLVMAGFNSNSCYPLMGELIDSPRCAQYALYAVFVGFLVTLLFPLLIIALLWLLVQEENGK